jgi:glycosyltransferase involved in cell wall biosynthesis
MRVAYVNLILARGLAGVEKKLWEQASCSPMGIDFFLLNRFCSGKKGRLNLVGITHGVDYRDLVFRKFSLIEKSIDLSKYDLVILRYPLADRSYGEFIRKYRVISEHHSDEVSELRSTVFGQSPLYLKLLALVRLALEVKYGHPYRERCSGIVAVTDELREKETRGIGAKIPSLTIPNGIDVEAVAKTGFRKLDGQEFNLVFVGSRSSPWHGLERVITSVSRYSGPYALRLHIVGETGSLGIKGTEQRKLIYHGVKRGVELDEVFAKANMAVSTMGLYRIKMNEAASLKTREYTARGIPFILGYRDVDLVGVEEKRKFFLEVPNNGKEISVEKILNFHSRLGEKFRSSSDLSDYMREYALERMDWRGKMMKYMDFCSVVSKSFQRGF